MMVMNHRVHVFWPRFNRFDYILGTRVKTASGYITRVSVLRTIMRVQAVIYSSCDCILFGKRQRVSSLLKSLSSFRASFLPIPFILTRERERKMNILAHKTELFNFLSRKKIWALIYWIRARTLTLMAMPWELLHTLCKFQVPHSFFFLAFRNSFQLIENFVLNYFVITKDDYFR